METKIINGLKQEQDNFLENEILLILLHEKQWSQYHSGSGVSNLLINGCWESREKKVALCLPWFHILIFVFIFSPKNLIWATRHRLSKRDPQILRITIFILQGKISCATVISVSFAFLDNKYVAVFQFVRCRRAARGQLPHAADRAWPGQGPRPGNLFLPGTESHQQPPSCFSLGTKLADLILYLVT